MTQDDSAELSDHARFPATARALRIFPYIRMMDAIETHRLLSTAQRAAREAGQILLSHLGRLGNIETKNGQQLNLVTVADREAELRVIEIIREDWPDHAVLGEEGGAHSGTAPYTWIIDPLDGTTNFTHAFPIFSVSIAIEHHGDIIAGVVYDPVRDELFHAVRGGGAWLNDTRIRVSETVDIGRAMLVTGFPYNVRENPDYCRERFIAFLQSAQAVRRLGSAALDCAWVASGRLDGFWEVALQPWDKAAGVLLIEEAGGRVSDFSGGPHSVYDVPLLASNGHIHDTMVRILEEATSITITMSPRH
jgi:myo-inositol-1(or 4)-monophosphatase